MPTTAVFLIAAVLSDTDLIPSLGLDLVDRQHDRGGSVCVNSFPGFLNEASAFGYAAAGSCCGVK
jgi:hypothetical protein